MPALEDWFSVSIRRGRRSFVLSNLALWLTFTVCYGIWFFFAESERGKLIGLAVFGAPAAIASYFLSAQRLRDFNVSGWFAALWIPINALDDPIRGALSFAAVLVLCGIPGTAGPNKFGNQPSS